jgi:hypothetical protein
MATGKKSEQSLVSGGKVDQLGDRRFYLSSPRDPHVKFVTPEPHDLIYRIIHTAHEAIVATMRHSREFRDKVKG